MNGWWKVRLFITMPFIHQALGFNERKWQWKAASSSCWWIDPFFISLEAAHCQHQHLIDYLIHILGIAEKLRMSQACDSKMDQNECVSNSVLSSVSWWIARKRRKHNLMLDSYDRLIRDYTVNLQPRESHSTIISLTRDSLNMNHRAVPKDNRGLIMDRFLLLIHEMKASVNRICDGSIHHRTHLLILVSWPWSQEQEQDVFSLTDSLAPSIPWSLRWWLKESRSNTSLMKQLFQHLYFAASS